MSADMRCGHAPCDGFYPLKYYADTLRVNAPDVKAAYTVLGIVENKSVPAAINTHFLTMTIDVEGKPVWWKTAEGESRCRVDTHCQAYYLQVRKLLGGGPLYPSVFSGKTPSVLDIAKHLDEVASARVNWERSCSYLWAG